MTQDTERTDTTTDTTEPPYATDAPLDGLIDAALKIAHQDPTLRRNLKEAILRDDTAAALEAAGALVGSSLQAPFLP